LASDPVALGLLALLVVCVALLLWAERADNMRLRWLSKPVASAAFVALAVQAGALQHPWGLAMVAGFVGCWWGDVLLIPASRKVFLAGIAAFALGHVGFAVSFVLRGIDPVRAGVTALLLVPLAAGVLRWLLPHVSGVMVSAAAGTSGLDAGGHGMALLVGAVLFWLSDLCVARQRFVAPGFVNRAVGLPLYYGAQVVLALACGG
jgi:uncharacterized membrane protein YhhN